LGSFEVVKIYFTEDFFLLGIIFLVAHFEVLVVLCYTFLKIDFVFWVSCYFLVHLKW